MTTDSRETVSAEHAEHPATLPLPKDDASTGGLAEPIPLLGDESPDEGDITLLAAIESVRTEVAGLASQFEERLRYDKAKEQAFDRLYADFELARVGSEFQRMRPFYFDLILLFDRLDKAVETHLQGCTPPSGSNGLLVSLREELLEILARRGVELISPSPQVFDASVQRVIGTEVAGDQDQENSIATVVRKGFRLEHHLIRAEEVILKKRLRTTSTSGSCPSSGENRD